MSDGATGTTVADDATAAEPHDPSDEESPAGAAATPADAAPDSLLRNRTFVRFFLGQFVTNAGDSLYAVAIMWLVFDLSGSTALTGVANAMLLLPYLLQVVAGPLVDRFDVKRILVGSQVGQGVVVLVVPLAAYTGHLHVGLLLAVIPLLAVLTLLTFPVPSTVLPRIVREDQLSKGNSLLSTVTLGLDMIFDAAGGLFIAAFGATALFLLDSLTFAVATVLFVGMVVPSVDGGGEPTEDSESGDPADDETTVRDALAAYAADMRAGVDVLRGTLFVDMLVTSAVANFAIGVTLAILPSFGAQLGGPAMYGAMLGALGVGRLVGSASASYLSRFPYGRMNVVASLGSAALWVASVYAPSTALTVVLFGLAWVSGGAKGVMVATMNQKAFPEQLLGRVSSLKGTAATATLPVGSLAGGLLAEQLGTTTTMALAASGFAFAGVYFAVRPELRRLPAVDDVGPADFGVDLAALDADEDGEPSGQEDDDAPSGQEDD